MDNNSKSNLYQGRSSSQPPNGHAHGQQAGIQYRMYDRKSPRASSMQPPGAEDQESFYEPPAQPSHGAPPAAPTPPPAYYPQGAYYPPQSHAFYPPSGPGYPPGPHYGQTLGQPIPQNNRFFNGFLGQQDAVQDYIVYCQPVPARFPERQQISLGRINQAEFETMAQLFAVNNQVQLAIESHYRQLEQRQPNIHLRGRPQDPFEQAYYNAGGHPAANPTPMPEHENPMHSIYPFQSDISGSMARQARKEAGAFQQNQPRNHARASQQRPNYPPPNYSVPNFNPYGDPQMLPPNGAAMHQSQYQTFGYPPPPANINYQVHHSHDYNAANVPNQYLGPQTEGFQGGNANGSVPFNHQQASHFTDSGPQLSRSHLQQRASQPATANINQQQNFQRSNSQPPLCQRDGWRAPSQPSGNDGNRNVVLAQDEGEVPEEAGGGDGRRRPVSYNSIIQKWDREGDKAPMDARNYAQDVKIQDAGRSASNRIKYHGDQGDDDFGSQESNQNSPDNQQNVERQTSQFIDQDSDENMYQHEELIQEDAKMRRLNQEQHSLPVSYSNNHPHYQAQNQKQSQKDCQQQIDPSSQPREGILKNKQNNNQIKSQQNTQHQGGNAQIYQHVQMQTDGISRLRYLDTLNLIQIYNKRSRVSNFLPGIKAKEATQNDRVPAKQNRGQKEQNTDRFLRQQDYLPQEARNVDCLRQHIGKLKLPAKADNEARQGSLLLDSNKKLFQIPGSLTQRQQKRDKSSLSPSDVIDQRNGSQKSNAQMYKKRDSAALFAVSKTQKPFAIEKHKPPEDRRLNQELMFGDLQMSRPAREVSEGISQSPVAPHLLISQIGIGLGSVNNQAQKLQDYTHTSSESFSEQIEDLYHSRQVLQDHQDEEMQEDAGDSPMAQSHRQSSPENIKSVQSGAIQQAMSIQRSPEISKLNLDMIDKGLHPIPVQEALISESGKLNFVDGEEQRPGGQPHLGSWKKQVEESKEEAIEQANSEKAEFQAQKIPAEADTKPESKHASGLQTKRSYNSQKRKQQELAAITQNQALQPVKIGAGGLPAPAVAPPKHVLMQKAHKQSKVVQITYDENRTRYFSKMENQRQSRQERMQKRQFLKEQHYNEILQVQLLNMERNIGNQDDEELTGLEDEEEKVNDEDAEQEGQRPSFTNQNQNRKQQTQKRGQKPKQENAIGKKRELGQISKEAAILDDDFALEDDINMVAPASESARSQSPSDIGVIRKRKQRQNLQVEDDLPSNNAKELSQNKSENKRQKVDETGQRSQNEKRSLFAEVNNITEQSLQFVEIGKLSPIKQEEKCLSKQNEELKEQVDMIVDDANKNEEQQQRKEPTQQVGKPVKNKKKSEQKKVEKQAAKEPEVKVRPNVVEQESNNQQNSSSFDPKFDLIHAEFEKEFWKTPEMQKKGPTYLVFHRFQYQRMKNQYPDLQCYQLSLMVSNKWDKLSINQKEVWRKNHLRLLKEVNDYKQKVQEDMRQAQLQAQQEALRQSQNANRPVKVTRICQDDHLVESPDQIKETPSKEHNTSSIRNNKSTEKKLRDQSEGQEQSRASEPKSDCSKSENGQLDDEGRRIGIAVDEGGDSEKKQEEADQGFENEQQLMEGEQTQIPSNKGGPQTLKDNMTDGDHMLDDEDWYTNMMKQIKDNDKAECEEMNNLKSIINRPQLELYPDLEPVEIFRTFKVTTRENLLLLDHKRQCQSLSLWNKPLYCVYRQIKEYDDAEKQYENQLAYEEMKAANPKLTRAQFQKKHATKIRPMAPEHGHWRIFARGDTNTERPHLIDLNDIYFEVYPEQNEIE